MRNEVVFTAVTDTWHCSARRYDIEERCVNLIAQRVIYLVTGEHIETKNPAVASS